MPVQVKGRDACSFCQNRTKKGLGPCGHHGGDGNAHKKGQKRDDLALTPKPEKKPQGRPRKEEPAVIVAGVKATARALLTQLEAKRTRLDLDIAAVKRLAEAL
jgi:hypothetical protein